MGEISGSQNEKWQGPPSKGKRRRKKEKEEEGEEKKGKGKRKKGKRKKEKGKRGELEKMASSKILTLGLGSL